MPEINGPGSEPPEKRRFISEKIVKQPMTRRQIAKRAGAFCLLAVLFGAIAAVSFTVASPLAQRYLGEEPTEESPSVTIPRDEPETVPVTEAPTDGLEEETEPIEEVIQSAIEKYKYTVNDYNNLYGSLRTVGQEADEGIVIIHSVQHQTDWFDNPVENTGQFAGAIVGATKNELLILTSDAAVEEADSIKVVLSDGTEVDGVKKQSDKVVGMAIVGVKCADLDAETVEAVKTIELGNSYYVKQGDAVIAVGGPSGIVHSMDYGFISYVAKNVQMTDGLTRIMYTSMGGNTQTGTFLVNTSGQLIGWVTDEYKAEGNEGVTAVMAISDYKSVLERMMNGIASPYFGIQGQEISEAMAQEGKPQGVYVVYSVAGSPAYNAGIQNGDIITGIGDKAITSMKDFQSSLDTLTPESVVPVTIQRNGKDEYKELEFQVKIGAR